MDLHPDWKEFIDLLNSHQVEYVVVGAFAVAHCTSPRATADIDFVMRQSDANAGRLREALRKFGFSLTGENFRKRSAPNCILQLGTAPYRIDILTSILGVETEDLIENRVLGVMTGLPVHFPSKADLIKAKRASGRLKDLVDLKNLESRPRNETPITSAPSSIDANCVHPS